MTATARFAAANAVPRPLTDGQLAALRLVVNGCSDTQIGRRLGITRTAASSRLGHAYKRLGVHDRSHAVAVALVLGVIRPDEVAVPSPAARIAHPAAKQTAPAAVSDANPRTAA